MPVKVRIQTHPRAAELRREINEHNLELQRRLKNGSDNVAELQHEIRLRKQKIKGIFNDSQRT